MPEAQQNLVVVGGGEHARVVVEAARSRPELWNVLGFLDPVANPETERRLGLEHLGDDGAAGALAQRARTRFVLGIGATVASSPRREQLAAELRVRGVEWGNVVHRGAWLSPTAELASGVVVCAAAALNTGARIGDHVIVNTAAVVEHDVEIGEFSHVGPGAVVGGGAVIGRRVYLGLGARVRDHARVGDGAVVGMGAVVVGDVAAGDVVLGVPARRRGAAGR